MSGRLSLRGTIIHKQSIFKEGIGRISILCYQCTGIELYTFIGKRGVVHSEEGSVARGFCTGNSASIVEKL